MQGRQACGDLRRIGHYHVLRVKAVALWNGIYIGSGTLDVSNNIFSNNLNGITVQAGARSSTSTIVWAFGNNFINNPRDGIFAQLDAGAPHELIATIGGWQSGQANYFSGQGFHAIGCSAPTGCCSIVRQAATLSLRLARTSNRRAAATTSSTMDSGHSR
jgi:hypothetical protein